MIMILSVEISESHDKKKIESDYLLLKRKNIIESSGKSEHCLHDFTEIPRYKIYRWLGSRPICLNFIVAFQPSYHLFND